MAEHEAFLLDFPEIGIKGAGLSRCGAVSESKLSDSLIRLVIIHAFDLLNSGAGQCCENPGNQ